MQKSEKIDILTIYKVFNYFILAKIFKKNMSKVKSQMTNWKRTFTTHMRGKWLKSYCTNGDFKKLREQRPQILEKNGKQIRTFNKNDVKISMERCSNSSRVREMQIKTIVRFSSSDWQKSQSWWYRLLSKVEKYARPCAAGGTTTQQHNLCDGSSSTWSRTTLTFTLGPLIIRGSNRSRWGQWELIWAHLWVFLTCFHHSQGTFLLSVTRHSNYFKPFLLQAQSQAFPQGHLILPLRICTEIIFPTTQKYLCGRWFTTAFPVIIKYWKLPKWENIWVRILCICEKRIRNIFTKWWEWFPVYIGYHWGN